MHEAASLGSLDTFVVCCPKDLTMFEDARKTSGHEGDFVVQDLAELVAEAIDLKSIDLKEVPALVDRITEAAATRIADTVADRLAERLAETVTERVLSELADRAPTLAAAAAAPQPAPADEPEQPAEAAPAAGPWRATPVSAATLPPYEVPAKEGPRVLVAVKRVGELNPDFAIDEAGGTIADEHFEYELNEWDEAALEEALLLTEKLERRRSRRRHHRPGGCRGDPAPRARQGRAPGRPGVGREPARRRPGDPRPRARGSRRAGIARTSCSPARSRPISATAPPARRWPASWTCRTRPSFSALSGTARMR